jgi:hypothetical protein
MTAYRFDPGSARDIVARGCWFRDAAGRYVLFRGVNFGGRSKLPPYLPILPLDARDLSPESVARFSRELEAVQPQLDLLQRLGFNIVRFLVMWKALEPRPNPDPTTLLPEGQRYLELVRTTLDALYARGLFAILDFHQDIAHERCGGDGFPDWALATDAADATEPGDATAERPASPHASDAYRPCDDAVWGTSYYAVPWLERALGLGKTSVLVRRTLNAFWRDCPARANGHGGEAYRVRSHLAATIGATERYFQAQGGGRGHPAILGYEPFNEPHPAGIPKREFEECILPAFYCDVLAAMRRPSADGGDGDACAFLFAEPRMDWITYPAEGPEYGHATFTRTPQSYLPTPLLGANDPDESVGAESVGAKRVVFAFHYYDPWMFFRAGLPLLRRGVDMRRKEREWPAIFARLRAAATSRGLVPFLTEFGADQDWARFSTRLRPAVYHRQQARAYMDLQFQQVERHLLNATYWQYDLYNTREAKDNWNEENFSLLGPDRAPRHLDIVARPYPLRSSAEPVLLAFDLATRHGVVVLRGPVVAAPTVIYVPGQWHYREGFEVRATSAVVTWDAGRQLIYWWPDPTTALHQLILCPAGGFDPARLPRRYIASDFPLEFSPFSHQIALVSAPALAHA